MRRVDAALDDVTARIGRAIQMAVETAVDRRQRPAQPRVPLVYVASSTYSFELTLVHS